jgi:hypothetical protein
MVMTHALIPATPREAPDGRMALDKLATRVRQMTADQN